MSDERKLNLDEYKLFSLLLSKKTARRLLANTNDLEQTLTFLMKTLVQFLHHTADCLEVGVKAQKYPKAHTGTVDQGNN